MTMDQTASCLMGGWGLSTLKTCKQLCILLLPFKNTNPANPKMVTSISRTKINTPLMKLLKYDSKQAIPAL
jgi:hypothetical protein